MITFIDTYIIYAEMVHSALLLLHIFSLCMAAIHKHASNFTVARAYLSPSPVWCVVQRARFLFFYGHSDRNWTTSHLKRNNVIELRPICGWFVVCGQNIARWMPLNNVNHGISEREIEKYTQISCHMNHSPITNCKQLSHFISILQRRAARFFFRHHLLGVCGYRK